MITATINQPCIFPRLHLIDRLNYSDVYVNLVSAQFSRHNDQAVLMVSDRGTLREIRIPIRHTGLQSVALTDAIYARDDRWESKTIKTLAQIWSRAPGKEYALDIFRTCIRDMINGCPVADMGHAQLLFARSLLGIQTEIVLDGAVSGKIDGDPSEWMLSLCESVRASAYYCGKVAFDAYIDKSEWARRGVTFIPQDWTPPAIGQARLNTSLLDVVAHGDDAVSALKSGLTWRNK